MRAVIPALLMISILSCSKPTPFEVRASLASVADPARRYQIHATGSYPAGADMAEDYHASLLIQVGEDRHRIGVRAKRFTPVLERIDSSKGFASDPAQPFDPALLTRMLETFDPAAPRERIAAEATELFDLMQAAGMGPKIGLPQTRVLRLISVSNAYR